MKHLIYLIDGTWLFAGALTLENTHSNVFNLTDRLAYVDRSKENVQIAHYIRGIGSTRGLRKITAGGFSFAIDETIQDIYVNICTNFNAGDKVYLIGFSRGAIIARAVCELLDFGLLNSSSVRFIDEIWTHFQKSQTTRSENDKDAPSQKSVVDSIEKIDASHFNTNFKNVEFLGLFDTVIGGVGFLKEQQFLNKISRFSPACVQHTVHLLALDETRVMFPAERFIGKRKGDGISNRTLEQVWMPGVHADIGGGYENRTLSDLSLLVMIDRIQHWTDLRFDVDDLEADYFEKGSLRPRIHNEHSGLRWGWSYPFKTARRVENGICKVHPIAFDLARTKSTYKGRLPDRYDTSRFASRPKSDYFISASWRDRQIKW